MTPALFLGHGNPLNALSENEYTRAWRQLGEEIPRPKAVLCVSAHWYVAGAAVTVATAPRTIHDFSGFPEALQRFAYPAPGDPELARRVASVLEGVDVALDNTWGLDHGAWAVLCHVYPDASVPVVQLSIDARQPGEWHWGIGQRLAALRDEGVLVVASGNVVHNLRAYAWGVEKAAPYDWAARFEEETKSRIVGGEDASLAGYGRLGRDAALSIPTPEHYLPLLYVLGTRQLTDAVSFPASGIEGGSVSMLAVRVG